MVLDACPVGDDNARMPRANPKGPSVADMELPADGTFDPDPGTRTELAKSYKELELRAATTADLGESSEG